MAGSEADLVPEHFALLWHSADRLTLTKLARRTDLPDEFHALAATHEDARVRAGYAENPNAYPDLLGQMAKREQEIGVIHALLRNMITPSETLVSTVEGNKELSLLALYRSDGPTALRLVAAATYAAQSDVVGYSAAKQIAELFGAEPAVYVAALENTSANGLAVASAAVNTCCEHLPVQGAFVEWVERHHPVIVRDEHVELLRTLVVFSVHPDVTTGRRRWALQHLMSSDDRAGAEALIAYETGSLPGQALRPQTVLECLTHLITLRHRVTDGILAPLLTDCVRTLVAANGPAIAQAALLLRNQYNPTLGQVFDLLDSEEDRSAKQLLVQLCGTAPLEYVKDIWSSLDGLELDTVEVVKLRAVRKQPDEALDRLAPLQQLLLTGEEYSSAAVERINTLGFGTVRWQTAAVLAPTWQGTLPQLLAAAEKL